MRVYQGTNLFPSARTSRAKPHTPSTPQPPPSPPPSPPGPSSPSGAPSRSCADSAPDTSCRPARKSQAWSGVGRPPTATCGQVASGKWQVASGRWGAWEIPASQRTKVEKEERPLVWQVVLFVWQVVWNLPGASQRTKVAKLDFGAKKRFELSSNFFAHGALTGARIMLRIVGSPSSWQRR